MLFINYLSSPQIINKGGSEEDYKKLLQESGMNEDDIEAVLLVEREVSNDYYLGSDSCRVALNLSLDFHHAFFICIIYIYIYIYIYYDHCYLYICKYQRCR